MGRSGGNGGGKDIGKGRRGGLKVDNRKYMSKHRERMGRHLEHKHFGKAAKRAQSRIASATKARPEDISAEAIRTAVALALVFIGFLLATACFVWWLANNE